MTYKETLFFIGKCLTISLEEKNRLAIENQLKTTKIDWDAVVKLSTAHYVFPALYCNLKRAGFLHYLPKELVNYMIHITDLNRERNKQIIKEAKEINTLLLANNIVPIFLKGTANLLEDLYEDIAERMVGDIDLLVANKDYKKSVSILKQQGYNNTSKTLENVKISKHYPRLNNPKKTMAIEVHFKIIKGSYNKKISYQELLKTSIVAHKNIKILNSEYQSIHTIFNKQINDLGYWYKKVSLRNLYDIYLLSNKTNILKTIKNYSFYFNIANTFLASASHFLTTNKISFELNKKSKKFVQKQLIYIEDTKKMKQNKKRWSFYFMTKNRIQKLIMAFYNKDVSLHLLHLLKSKVSS